MNQKTIIQIIFVMVFGGYLQNSLAQTTTAKSVAGSLPTDGAAMGQYICNHIDLNRPDMASVKSAASAGDYLGALQAWRNAKVSFFRKVRSAFFLSILTWPQMA